MRPPKKRAAVAFFFLVVVRQARTDRRSAAELSAAAALSSAPAILQPIDARGNRCVIVLSLHQATTCELSRFEHAVRTRPRHCDVVALYNIKLAGDLSPGARAPRRDATYDGFDRAARLLRLERTGVHIVPFEDGETMAALLRANYSRQAIDMFSPSKSRLSKVVWFAWGAVQTYDKFWFSESDVLLRSSWEALVKAYPLSKAEGRHINGSEQLVCANYFGGMGAARSLKNWFWADPTRCTFCSGRKRIRVIAGCLLALSGYTRGLVQAVSAKLREGRMRAHHELLVPYLCVRLKTDHGGETRRTCSVVNMQSNKDNHAAPSRGFRKTAMRTDASLLSWSQVCQTREAMREERSEIHRLYPSIPAAAEVGGRGRRCVLRTAASQSAVSLRQGILGGVGCSGSNAVCAFHPAKCSAFRYESMATAPASQESSVVGST